MTSEQQMESDCVLLARWFAFHRDVIFVAHWTFKVTNRLTFRETIGTYARTPASPRSYNYYTGQWATVVVDLFGNACDFVVVVSFLLLYAFAFYLFFALFTVVSNHCEICRMFFNSCFGPLGFLKYIPWHAWLNDRMGPTVLRWLGSKASSN